MHHDGNIDGIALEPSSSEQQAHYKNGPHTIQIILNVQNRPAKRRNKNGPNSANWGVLNSLENETPEKDLLTQWCSNDYSKPKQRRNRAVV